ncbi:hypothetical protein MBM_08082 [Drepanopeziza brunnea f. sp. 'multigermtubi' MB_m1]|uniref:Uncharacterized protein n=1 Tax=Marssonina brunnea f. sp. multigermtubi (strain MB_m1) TaxID=1072389 RepID=K1WLX0_MARBU|nr:uncharacterized protein MBM_08082 [Drepanopeziza brunnea f. sp. 'multigermtubi' MB_m1]EKD13881.1 hypothetical protein MBM_08082 [Drepanopeziza brunnea f. sp. 'multigermtubi' MB_m1]
MTSTSDSRSICKRFAAEGEEDAGWVRRLVEDVGKDGEEAANNRGGSRGEEDGGGEAVEAQMQVNSGGRTDHCASTGTKTSRHSLKTQQQCKSCNAKRCDDAMPCHNKGQARGVYRLEKPPTRWARA